MKINHSKVSFSSIVGIGQKVALAAKTDGQEYLELNRGVNAVVNIDLSEVIKGIDFNSKEYQVYAPNLGMESLRRTIIKEYFPSSEGKLSNLAIMPGGMPGLDLILQTLNVDTVYFPKFYWGSYSKMASIRNRSFTFYDDIKTLSLNIKENENSCVFVCNPSNPTGIDESYPDVLEAIREMDRGGITVIYDCPYSKLFHSTHEDIFDNVGKLSNVIVCESFSKSLGVSGARLGFIWSNNDEFNKELNIRVLYEFNGVCSPSQILVNSLLSTDEGKKAVKDFKGVTIANIRENSEYLKRRGFLVDEIYKDKKLDGMFAVIKFSEDFLFKNKIGAVGLDKFTYHDKDIWSSYSRICLSVPNEKFIKFFNKI
jgi:aspartate/methionine/tyrosine aminotransferase